jgi:cytochrome c biogenesis protein ResB
MLKLLSSVRFAIVMFILVAIISAAATFLNQPELFRSAFFLLPAGLFALSLLTCTVDSLVRRPRRTLTGYAHDVIHVGVLILILGGALTLLVSQEDRITLQVGERATVRGEWEIELTDSVRTESNWESTLEVRREGVTVATEVLSVNNPVTVGGARLLQDTWGERSALILENAQGQRFAMMPGEGLASQDTSIVLEEAEDTPLGVRFARFENSERTGDVAIERGMEIAGLTVVDSERRVQSGLQVVYDPGAPVALVGAIFLVIGLGLYVMKKVKEESRSEGTAE